MNELIAFLEFKSRLLAQGGTHSVRFGFPHALYMGKGLDPLQHMFAEALGRAAAALGVKTAVRMPDGDTLREVLKGWARAALKVRYATGMTLHQAARHVVPKPLQTPKILHAVETIMYFEEFVKSLDSKEDGQYNSEVNRGGNGHEDQRISGEVPDHIGSAPDGGP